MESFLRQQKTRNDQRSTVGSQLQGAPTGRRIVDVDLEPEWLERYVDLLTPMADFANRERAGSKVDSLVGVAMPLAQAKSSPQEEQLKAEEGQNGPRAGQDKTKADDKQHATHEQDNIPEKPR